MILDKSTRSLKLLLGEAKTSQEVVCVLRVRDFIQERQHAITFPGTSNGVTAVTVCPAPLDNTERRVEEVIIYNADTIDHNIIFEYIDGATTYVLVKQLLPKQSSLIYTTAEGWKIGSVGGNFAPIDSPVFTTQVTLPDGSIDTISGWSSLKTIGLLDISGATAGQIKFPSVQNPSANANTLDDYEVGAWTPTDASGAGLTFIGVSASYVKIGRLVLAFAKWSYPTTVDVAYTAIDGLPFTIGNNGYNEQGFLTIGNAIAQKLVATVNTTQFILLTTTGGNVTNAQVAGATIRCIVAYLT